MFQLLGVGLVRIAKTRFGGEEKIEERRPFPRSFLSLVFPCGNSSSGTFQVFVSAPFLCEYCFFIDKAFGCSRIAYI